MRRCSSESFVSSEGLADDAGAARGRLRTESLAALAADARQKGEALARLEVRMAEVEAQLAHLSASGPLVRMPPSANALTVASSLAVVVPSRDVSLEEGTSFSSSSTEKERDLEHDILQRSIHPTVWDAPAIIGLPAVGSGASAMLCVSMLLNGLLQIYICFILLTCDKFTNRRPWEDEVENARHWRVHVAHDASRLDASGASLAARVCGGDNSLSVASSQFQTLKNINAYLSLQPQQLVQRHIGIGPLLCSVCILIFVILILKELRCLATLCCALCSLPNGHTRVEDFALVALSRTRLLCILSVSGVRAAIAVVLLYAGVVWLAATTSITDLILNAAALGFVLDLDERAYATIVPAAVHTFVSKLRPLSYRRPPRSIDAVLPFVSMVVLVSLSIALLLIPNMNDMLRVKGALCGGNKDFVIKQNVAGYVLARETVPYGADDGVDAHDMRADLRSLAVSELLDIEAFNPNSTYITQYSMRKYTWEDFEEDASIDVMDFAKAIPCEDATFAHNGLLVKTVPAYFYTMRETTGLHKGKSLEEVPFNCSEYARAGFCQSNALLRVLCPLSCGCTDPRSGLLLGQASQGCPPKCSLVLEAAAAELPCVDTGSGEGWRTYWEEWAAFAGRLAPQLRGTYLAYGASKIANGCNDSAPDPVLGENKCDQRFPYLARRGVRSIAAFCPRLCCHGPDPDPLCPRSCPRSGGAGRALRV